MFCFGSISISAVLIIQNLILWLRALWEKKLIAGNAFLITTGNIESNLLLGSFLNWQSVQVLAWNQPDHCHMRNADNYLQNRSSQFFHPFSANQFLIAIRRVGILYIYHILNRQKHIFFILMTFIHV